MIVLRSGSATDVGRVRTSNQDVALEEPDLFAVADGMGGHAGGDVAARDAVDALVKAFRLRPTVEGLRQAVAAANRAVWRHAQAQSALRGMGTTMTATALVTDGDHQVVALANVGDSRAYVFTGGQVIQVTSDHSLAEEKVRRGQLTEAEAASHPHRHILTRALGISSGVDVDLWELHLRQGDRILLCSDGLTNEVDSDQIASFLGQVSDPAGAARALVKAALDHGGNDNVTVVVVDVVQADEQGPRPAATPAVVPLTTSARRASAQRILTLRLGLFFLLAAAILAGAYALVRSYAMEAFTVALDRGHLVVFQGRQFLWFKPQLVDDTPVTTAEVLPYVLPSLRQGHQVSSLGAARRYVANLHAEFLQSRAAAPTRTPTTSAAFGGFLSSVSSS